jgi:hypothetical protein
MMISWHVASNPVEAKGNVHEAAIHRCQMRVEPIAGDGWRWSIRTLDGADLTIGQAPSLSLAKEEAEDEFFAIHPVNGHWFETYCSHAVQTLASH